MVITILFVLSISHRRQSCESADGKKSLAPNRNRRHGAQWGLLRRGRTGTLRPPYPPTPGGWPGSGDPGCPAS
eukprot:11025425-Heterocapsa_arctica.AAC.1